MVDINNYLVTLQKLVYNLDVLTKRYNSATLDFESLVEKRKGEIDDLANTKVSEAEAELDKYADDKIDYIRSSVSDISDEIDSFRTIGRVLTNVEYERQRELLRKKYISSGMLFEGTTYDVSYYRVPIRGIWTHNGLVSDNRNRCIHFGRRWYNSLERVKDPMTFLVDGHVIWVRQIDNNRARVTELTYNDYDDYSIPLPEPVTSKATVNDSSNLSVDLRQGDMIILNDTERELIYNGDFSNGTDGWGGYNSTLEVEDGVLKVTADIENVYSTAYTKLPLVRDLLYVLEFDYVDSNSEYGVGVYLSGLNPLSGYNYVKTLTPGKRYRIVFRANTPYYPLVTISFYFNNPNKDPNLYWKIDNVSLKMLENQPVFAVRDVSAGTDIFTDVKYFNGNPQPTRKDLIFMEVWREKISDTGFAFPNGCVQYIGAYSPNSVPLVDVDFDGWETYCQYGKWQEPGSVQFRGWKWDDLTEAEKSVIVSQKENNITIDENGEFWQTRFRIRVVKGIGDNFRMVYPYYYGAANSSYLSYGQEAYTAIIAQGPDKDIDFEIGYGGNDAFITSAGYTINTMHPGFFYSVNKQTYAIPLLLVQRRNDGIFNVHYNPFGVGAAYDEENSTVLPVQDYGFTDNIIKSLQDCFNKDLKAALDADGGIVRASDDTAVDEIGYINTKMSGSPFYNYYADMPLTQDLKDLRYYADRPDLDKIYNDYFIKFLQGKLRLREKKIMRHCNLTHGVYPDDSNNVYYGTTFFTLGERATRIYTRGQFHAMNIGLTYHIETEDKSFGFIRSPKSGKFYNIVALQTSYNGFLLYLDPMYGDVTDDFIIDNDGTMKEAEVYVDERLEYTVEDKDYNIDLFGDYRPLKDRTLYKTSDGTVDLPKNTYIYCDSASNNNGVEGHYYRYKGDDIINVELDGTDGSANSSDGHIDLSDSNLWIDLGEDGDIGGYDLTKPSIATPVFTNREGERMFPIDLSLDSQNRGFFEFTKPARYIRKVFISKKDGTLADIPQTTDGTGYYWSSLNGLYVPYGIYSDLGYNSIDEMIDLAIIYVVYDYNTSSVNDLFVNSYYKTEKPVLLPNDVYNVDSMDSVDAVCSIIQKWPVAADNSSLPTQMKVTLTEQPVRNVINTANEWFDTSYGQLKHNPIDRSKRTPQVKVYPWLTRRDTYGTMKLCMLTNEVKYDSETGTYGDDNTIYFNYLRTRADLNGNTVRTGYYGIDLPYYYGDVR